MKKPHTPKPKKPKKAPMFNTVAKAPKIRKKKLSRPKIGGDMA